MTTSDQIQRFFGIHGVIEECKLKTDPQTGMSLGESRPRLCFRLITASELECTRLSSLSMRDRAEAYFFTLSLLLRLAGICWIKFVRARAGKGTGHDVAKEVAKKCGGSRIAMSSNSSEGEKVFVVLDGEGHLFKRAVADELERRRPSSKPKAPPLPAPTPNSSRLPALIPSSSHLPPTSSHRHHLPPAASIPPPPPPSSLAPPPLPTSSLSPQPPARGNLTVSENLSLQYRASAHPPPSSVPARPPPAGPPPFPPKALPTGPRGSLPYRPPTIQPTSTLPRGSVASTSSHSSFSADPFAASSMLSSPAHDTPMENDSRHASSSRTSISSASGLAGLPSRLPDSESRRSSQSSISRRDDVDGDHWTPSRSRSRWDDEHERDGYAYDGRGGIIGKNARESMQKGKSSSIPRLELQSEEETRRKLTVNGQPYVFISQTSLPLNGRVEIKHVREHFSAYNFEDVSFATRLFFLALLSLLSSLLTLFSSSIRSWSTLPAGTSPSLPPPPPPPPLNASASSSARLPRSNTIVSLS